MLLPKAVNAPHTLFQASGIPRNIIIDHQPAYLQIDTLASCIGRDQVFRTALVHRFTEVRHLTLTLYDVPPDVTGSLTLNGAGRTLALGVPGMNARLTFSGAAGQHVTARLSADSIASAKLSILRPGGTTLAGPVTPGLSGGTLAATLPAAGVYTILIDPVTYRTGTVTAAVTAP